MPNPNPKWAKGDAAVTAVEAELRKIASSTSKWGLKIELMTEALNEAAGPWNLAGDDRVLSMMRNSAGEIAEGIIKDEAERIKGLSNDEMPLEDKDSALSALSNSVEEISWLAEGFKASIKCEIAFARADLKMGKW